MFSVQIKYMNTVSKIPGFSIELKSKSLVRVVHRSA